MDIFDNFNHADNIMARKGFVGVDIVNQPHGAWSYVKSEVLVFSRPKPTQTSSGNFQFELEMGAVSALPASGEYINYFFSENLYETARLSCCYFKSSNFFPLKSHASLNEICNFERSNEETVEFNCTFRKNARAYLSNFAPTFKRNIFINFITNYKIKLYRKDEDGSVKYAFFWLLRNNNILPEAKEKVDQSYASYLTSGVSVNNTKALYETIIEIQKKIQSDGYNMLSPNNRNMILFGSPGTGKSYTLDKYCECANGVFETTFHPDYDYSDFVGQYRPKNIACKDDSQENSECKSKVVYSFTPGIFIKALKYAMDNPESDVLLRIEELNRGNTAAIFGDLFQLLDRDVDGKSKYKIDMPEEVIEYLNKGRVGGDIIKKVTIPGKLYIIATMNTSDQSLFPMDSAFKRRWTWKFIPIDLDDAKEFTIEIGNCKVNWGEFIEKVNEKILIITESEDKQLGNRFVNPENKIIDAETFVGKVLFYLWTDVFRHENHMDENNIFSAIKNDPKSESEKISFSKLYISDGGINTEIVKKLFSFLQLECSSAAPTVVGVSDASVEEIDGLAEVAEVNESQIDGQQQLNLES